MATFAGNNHVIQSSANQICDPEGPHSHFSNTTPNDQFAQLSLNDDLRGHTLGSLPAEMLECILHSLTNSDIVCLGLTCKSLNSLVLDIHKITTLKPLCPARPTAKSWQKFLTITPSFADLADDDFEYFMKRLWSWMAPRYLWCGLSRSSSNYVLRSNRHNEKMDCECAFSEYMQRYDYHRLVCKKRTGYEELHAARLYVLQAERKVVTQDRRLRAEGGQW